MWRGQANGTRHATDTFDALAQSVRKIERDRGPETIRLLVRWCSTSRRSLPWQPRLQKDFDDFSFRRIRFTA